jgi:preprotein translocase subunit SecE
MPQKITDMKVIFPSTASTWNYFISILGFSVYFQCLLDKF